MLTPHPGEMARLLDSSVREIQGARPQSARELAEVTRSVVVLKGSGTVVAAPGGHLSVNATGGPLLGTAGTGDVLAGLLGGLLAQGLEPWDAARLGVFLHGAAADRLATRLGSSGLLSSELADALPAAREALRVAPPVE